jgi:hypothetical protein
VLAFGIQVRGFKLGRNRRIFQREKILSTPSFGGEVKAVLTHVADLRHVKKKTLKAASTRYFQAKFTGHFSPNSSTFHCQGRCRHCDVQDTWWSKLKRLRFRVV